MLENGTLLRVDQQLLSEREILLKLAQKHGLDPRTRIQRNSMTESNFGGASFEYNGYFKIIDASERDAEGKITAYKVKVVDGATYNPKTGHSGSCPAYVNNFRYLISTWTSDTFTGTKYIRLHFNIWGDFFEASVNLELSDEVAPSSTNKDVYKDIGRVYISDTGMQIVQDATGVQYMDWFVKCQ